MALFNLLLLALAAVSLVFQLLTPVILNIPALAVVVITFVIAVFYFRRRRQKTRLPVFAGLNLVVQALFLVLSIGILVVITIPNESPEDSPAVVQGIRNILVSQGLIAKPKTSASPAVPQNATETVKEPVNAPDASAVQITVEDAEKPATKDAGAQTP